MARENEFLTGSAIHSMIVLCDYCCREIKSFAEAIMMKNGICQLDETKICDECQECMYCDLKPNKICDNCCECLDEADYRAIKIADIIMDPEKAKKF